MTMHTNSLPLQLTGTNGLNAQPQNMRGNATLNSDGVNFGATLTRQIEQRQLEQRQAQAQPAPQAQPQQAAPQAVAKPQTQAQASKPAANDSKAPVRETAKEPAKAGGKEAAKETAASDSADKTDAAQASTDTKTGSGEGEEAAPVDAKAAASATDMLAMLASLGQPQATAKAAPALVTEAAGGAQAGLKGKLGLEGVESAIKPDTNPLAAASGATQDKAAPGIDLRGLDLGKAGEQAAKLQADAGQFAAKLHDSAAALKETAAPEALTNIVAQTNALQNAQAAGAVPTDRLSARVGTPAWDNQVGQKVIWMVGGEEQSATLELNPPDLGPVQVVLNVSNDMASITFSSQQLEVRQALENSLPRLREMMNESGIALGNASVNSGNDGNGQQGQPGSGRSGGGGGNGGDSATVAEAAPRQRTSILGGAGAVDTFA